MVLSVRVAEHLLMALLRVTQDHAKIASKKGSEDKLATKGFTIITFIIQRSSNEDKEVKQLNMFIELYKRLQSKGYGDLEAFGLVASLISTNGTIDDLQEVHKVYRADYLNEFDKLINELEEYLNEKDSVTQSKVG